VSSATRDGFRVCRALSLSLTISSSNCVGDEKWNSRLSSSLSLVEGRHGSSAMRRGIRVYRSLDLVVMCRRRRDRASASLALSLSRPLETVVSALVLSSTDGDETWNPRLSPVSSASAVFAACEVLTLRFLPCCVPVA
jgi:hypothetical protein